MCSGSSAVAIGSGACATATAAVAIGMSNEVYEFGAVAFGNSLKANKSYQTVVGTYNESDTTSLFVVGVGAMNDRKNGLTIDSKQVAHFPGSVVVGENKDEVATKAYIDAKLAEIGIAEEGTF